MKENKKKKWLVTKTIKFDSKKLAEAKKRGRIKDLAEMCRKQLDVLISD